MLNSQSATLLVKEEWEKNKGSLEKVFELKNQAVTKQYQLKLI